MDRDTKLIRDILRRGSKTAADELIRTYYDEIYIYTSGNALIKMKPLTLTQNILLRHWAPCPPLTAKKPLSVHGCTV